MPSTGPAFSEIQIFVARHTGTIRIGPAHRDGDSAHHGEASRCPAAAA
jgi:hypothetical protein